MLFDDVNSFEKYPEFKAYVHKIVFRERESAMAKESIRRVHQAARDFAARDEAASQMAIMPKVIKPSRGVPTNKRTASDVIKQESRFFEDDDLATASRLPLSKGFLPLVDIVGKKFGLTNPTPDVIYGLKYPTVLGTGPAKLSDAARAAIGLVTGVRHAFFLIECKGPTEGIEQAENQAIRGGATLVAARRFLNRLAKGEQVLSLETPGIDPIGTEHGAAQTDPAEAEINNLAAPNTTNVDTFPATSSTIVPPQSFVESAAIPATPTPKPTTSLDSPSNAESPGGHPDFSSIAFSCSWATQMANIFVHWCECRNDGPEIYHMIKLHGYLYGDDVHLADLREHSHNILDWGVDPKRRQELAKLEMDIEKMEKMKKGRVS